MAFVFFKKEGRIKSLKCSEALLQAFPEERLIIGEQGDNTLHMETWVVTWPQGSSLSPAHPQPPNLSWTTK